MKPGDRVVCNGDRVVVVAHWSSFRGMRGEVVQVTPHTMVLIDGDTYPIRVGDREIAKETSPPIWTAGG
jgi:ribosomal protein L24